MAPELSVAIGPLTLSNPVGVASGPFASGSKYKKLMEAGNPGALYTKAVTLEPRSGNAMPRMAKTTMGMLNSIGLANLGSEGFVSQEYPMLKNYNTSVIVNLAGSKPKDYLETLEYLEEHAPLSGYEVNLSCPNVKRGGMALGIDPHTVREITSTLRGATDKALIVKLSPNVTDIAEIALAAQDGGADAVSCINTLVGMRIDTKTKKPVISTGTAGLSGPAILPVGLAATYRVSRVVGIPVIGIGGISCADDAIQYLLAGASAVQLGTINFVNPAAHREVLDGIRNYMVENEMGTIADFHSFLPKAIDI